MLWCADRQIGGCATTPGVNSAWLILSSCNNAEPVDLRISGTEHATDLLCLKEARFLPRLMPSSKASCKTTLLIPRVD